jgi:hypothetical protein
MKINKKILSIGCATAGLAIIASTALVSVALNQKDTKDPNKLNPIIHTGEDHEEINSFIDRSYVSKKCVSFSSTENVLFFDEQKFRENINDILRYALKKMNQFTNNYDKYTIELNYQFITNKKINIDVV